MPINGATVLKSGATTTFAAGTSVTLTTDGLDIKQGVHVIDASVTDYRTRPNCAFRNRPPALQSDGTYGKGKRAAQVDIPKVLASGKQGFPRLRIELEDYPEMSQAEVDELRSWGAQVLKSANFDAFWRTGSLS